MLCESGVSQPTIVFPAFIQCHIHIQGEKLRGLPGFINIEKHGFAIPAPGGVQVGDPRACPGVALAAVPRLGGHYAFTIGEFAEAPSTIARAVIYYRSGDDFPSGCHITENQAVPVFWKSAGIAANPAAARTH